MKKITARDCENPIIFISNLIVNLIIWGSLCVLLALLIISVCTFDNPIFWLQQTGDEVAVGATKMFIGIILAIGSIIFIGNYLSNRSYVEYDRNHDDCLKILNDLTIFNIGNYVHNNDDDNDDKKLKNNKMSKKAKSLLISIIVIVLIGLGVSKCFTVVVPIYNLQQGIRNEHAQKLKERDVILLEFTTSLESNLNVSKTNAEYFKNNIQLIMENRMDGDKLMWKWIKEINPNANYQEVSELFKNMQSLYVEKRDVIININTSIFNLVKKDDNLRTMFPSNLVIKYFGDTEPIK